jgi:hypothetical protein
MRSFARPDWLERKIDFQLARQRAYRTHVQPCDCDLCITSEEIHRRLQERIEAEHRRAGEPPF